MTTDVLSELLIAQLLEEDVRILTDQQKAEAFQLTQLLADTGHASGHIQTEAEEENMSDIDLAIRLMAEEARRSGDAALAQSLQHSEDTEATVNRQYAMKLAASEKRIMLDAEFAKKLQEMGKGMDAPDVRDAEKYVIKTLC